MPSSPQTAATRPRPSLEERVTAQEAWLLRHSLSHLLERLARDTQQVRQLESEMEAFLSEYYERVGGYFEQLERLNYSIAALDEEREAQAQSPAALSPTPLAREIKQLYRSLVKEFHPDRLQAAGSKPRSEVIQRINSAYAAQDLAELWRIRLLAEQPGSAAERVVRYREYYRAMHQLVEQIAARRESMTSSAAYALMQRAQEARLEGQDLISHIIRKVRQQIGRKRSELAQLRLMQPCGVPAMPRAVSFA